MVDMRPEKTLGNSHEPSNVDVSDETLDEAVRKEKERKKSRLRNRGPYR
jgi:hypothetical protein